MHDYVIAYKIDLKILAKIQSRLCVNIPIAARKKNQIIYEKKEETDLVYI